LVKNRASASTHKKVVVRTLDGENIRAYLNPAQLGRTDPVDLLTPDGEHQAVSLRNVKSIYFVREFAENFEPERKVFFSRPKLDGLWVRLKFHDDEIIEGIVPNDLLALLDHGVQITPPDLHGQTLRLFIPRSALAELTVLGVVGVARRTPRPPAPPELARQPKLFGE
jgi:hypothetical protein